MMWEIVCGKLWGASWLHYGRGSVKSSWPNVTMLQCVLLALQNAIKNIKHHTLEVEGDGIIVMPP
jgi:hypothetical protein